MKTRLLFFVLLFTLGVFAAFAATPKDKHVYTVVIDPGHGGKDYGCIGKITNEKTIVLDVAKRLGDIIKKEHPDINVIYTRDDDRFIELSNRASIANKAAADLFISIHVNSVDKKTKGRDRINGASVYTLGLHRTDDNLAVAMRENSVIELEKDFSETYQGFDPSSSESYIIFELTQNLHQKSSVELADLIQRELMTTAGRADKGVRQSGFLVLRATSMPAVLVELDFICNPAAERFLDSSDGKDKCARSLANAFSTYLGRHSYGKGKGQSAQTSVSGELFYTIQFFSSVSPLSEQDEKLKESGDIVVFRQDKTYNYCTGKYKSLKDAKKSLHSVRKKYPDAFIIKMRDGVRIK